MPIEQGLVMGAEPERRLPGFEEVAISDSEWERYFASVAKRSKAAN
jgi:hypothetical protein